MTVDLARLTDDRGPSYWTAIEARYCCSWCKYPYEFCSCPQEREEYTNDRVV